MKTTKQTQQLLNLEKFEAILNGYKPSEKSLQTLRSLPLVLLVGTTAAGRNTLINLLVKTGNYYSIVSDTTRKPRTNNGIREQDGVEYWFKTEEEFLQGLNDGDYIEAAVIHSQQVSGARISRIEEAARVNKIAINEVQVNGAAHIYKFKTDTLIIFLLPPSFEVWMERIRARGDVDDAELRRRLESAVCEITMALNMDYYQFVINHEIHDAAEAVDEIANGRALDPKKQEIGRTHAERLLTDVQVFLTA